MEIIQENKPENRRYFKDPDSVEVNLYVRNGSVYLKVYFGANVKTARMYVLGYDNSKPILVPVNSGGYKVARVRPNQAGMLRFKLIGHSLDYFGDEIANAIREDIDWEDELDRRLEKNEPYDDLGSNPPNGAVELTGKVDGNKRVLIEIDEYEKESAQ